MAAWAAMFADRPEGGQKALGLAGRLEAAHGPFTLARRLVRVFGTVVEPLVFAMLDAGHDVLVCCRVAAELVRDQHARHILTALEYLGCPWAKNCLAVALFRRLWTRISSTFPSWSTARQR